jgi:heme exporter protein A
VNNVLHLATGAPLLRFDGVALRRGGRLLFDNLDIRLGPGERLQLTGPNGSGKSSLILLAAGLLRAERGTIERSEVAIADHRSALDGELPLIAALSFWLPAGGHQRLATALNALDLAGLIPVPVRLLSAGQLKRATLGRVFASGAPLWLLDEPLNALDRGGLEDFADLLDLHSANGGAIVAASHLVLPGNWQQLDLGQ